ncbi:MAG: phosphosulfolactate synthase [Candidatus Nitrosocosmicus sp.]|jgi:phosphosulfolactate synthase|uniref:phosphosulfolactate synthase n=1 Tax=Candidatus Nitrosocosmicus agrestis TaxID=2563600 RepID=UPI00122E667B|nr:phosphosulfolactate synthase [Candidatus Nitrosocosmicus sp. SS]KAA2283042.1 DNA mismatch repair protein MutT [Candidatus Nitrosocosmicus sp. SS]KAF0868501.1 DNA mismatch repair protein MutT [Candidatus Nitrosocosmicus sp. SS]MDR4490114.1 phosphosulfolactate synthase [Candidatus Nitrosocosmicus sp.]
MLDHLSTKRIDWKKPRTDGLTYIVDKFQGFDTGNFKLMSPLIDMVKIYGALPLLMSDEQLQDRINYYHEYDVLVSVGSSLTEYVLLEKSLDIYIDDVKRLGFDIIEIGENNIELPPEKKKQISDKLIEKKIQPLWKIGKKDPRRQLTFEQTIVKVNEALNVGAEKILLEGNLGYAAGIYDEKGNIKWNALGAITSKLSPNRIIFEAPLEIQQSALIAEFGQRVNLGEIDLENVFSIESQRKGFLSRSSYGISSMKKIAKGSPATKFIYYVIRNRNSMEQSELIHTTNLPRRTVQTGLEELKEQGLIVEKTNLDDIRKKIYYAVDDEWI